MLSPAHSRGFLEAVPAKKNFSQQLSRLHTQTHNLNFELDSLLFVFDGGGTVVGLVQEGRHISYVPYDLLEQEYCGVHEIIVLEGACKCHSNSLYMYVHVGEEGARLQQGKAPTGSISSYCFCEWTS